MNPDFVAAQFEAVLREGAPRRPRQWVAVVGVEESFMAGADQPLALGVEVHRAHEVCAALAECFQAPVGKAHENSRSIAAGELKKSTSSRQKLILSADVKGLELRGFTAQYRFAGGDASAGHGSDAKKLPELTP